MERERVPSALFAAALLASSAKLTSRERSLIVSLVEPFDIASPRAAAEAIALASRSAGVELPSSRLFLPSRFARARSLAAEWLGKRLVIVRVERVRAADVCVHDVPPILFAYGREDLLDQEAAAIVSSRKPRRITPGDLWIDAVKAFFHEAAEENYAIASSYGTLAYDLVSRLASRRETPLLLVCDGVLPFMDSHEKEAHFLAEWEGLFRNGRTLFLSPFPPGPVPRPAERLVERDRVCLALSSRIFVAAVRRGGIMELGLKQALLRRIHMTVLADDPPSPAAEGNSVLTARRVTAILEKRPASAIPRALAQCGSGSRPTAARGLLVLDQWPEQGAALIHYTRSCPGPWPGESLSAYLDAILEDLPSAGHTGFDTLMRILEEGRIRASGKLTRGSRPVVSLTECRPGEIQRLVRWRKGLIRWSFEPYGIAVDRKCLKDLGAEAVIYGDADVYSALPEERRHLFQLDAAAGPDWTAEREWRLSGDLRLDSIPRDKLMVIVAELEEARAISERFGCRVTLSGPITAG